MNVYKVYINYAFLFSKVFTYCSFNRFICIDTRKVKVIKPPTR